MSRFKRAQRWIVLAGVALLSCGYVVGASAAIAPPKLGGCKPLEEPPADGKQKAAAPGQGNKGQSRPAGEKPGKPT